MLKLKSLNPTSTIGIIAPASCEDKDFIDKKIEEFKSLGFNIKRGKHIYKSYGYLSGEDKERAEDLNSMFADSNIDAIVCLRGGYGSIRMAEHLNLNIIRNNPKPLCGYSDITLLLNYLNKVCKFPTFHTPMITSNILDPLTQEYFKNILTNKHSKIIYNMKRLCTNNYLVWNRKNFKGKLSGGNLSIICSTMGTPYEIEFKDRIILLEDVSESCYSIDRMLSQLITSKKLQKASGIILGNFTNCNNLQDHFSVNDLIKQKLIPLNIPIIQGFPFGHEYPNISFPIGSEFEFSATNDLLIQKKYIFKK